MKTEDILKVEECGTGIINLVRDRLFWQAWNRSAFLFITHIKEYQIHKRFVKKIAQETVWLGFPKTALENIQKNATDKNFTIEHISSDHIIISGVPQTSGYEKWWSGIIKEKIASPEKEVNFANFLPSYKIAYELNLHIHRATLKMPREFRYELGARVRTRSMDILESVYLFSGTKKKLPPNKEEIIAVAENIEKLRICVRVLKDLMQIGIEQWGFLNKQIENLLNCLRAEFRNCNTGTAKASLD